MTPGVGQYITVTDNFAQFILQGTPLLAAGSDGINGVTNAILLSDWVECKVINPVNEDVYLAKLNIYIIVEGNFKTR